MLKQFLKFIATTALALSCPLILRAQETEPIWDALLTQTQGWLGADGIYSLDLSYDSATGKRVADANDLYMFWFSDTFCGTTRDNGQEFADRVMVNHSFAVLNGNQPDDKKIEFFYKKDPQRQNTENIISGHYWLQDGIRYGNRVWMTGILVGRAWKPARIDAITIDVDPKTNRPDFSNIKVDENAPLSSLRDDAQVVWGAAICDDADDGYIYVFGYVDRFREGSRKDMIVARVEQDRFEDYGAWSYFNGKSWSSDPDVAFESQAAIVRGVSTEYSVTRIPTGVNKGKYVLAYTPGTINSKIAFRVGESPFGPYSEERVFYRSNVPEELPGVRCYNAKAHPVFSTQDGLLVSYNVNRLGDSAHKPTEYRPRFIRLSWNLINEQSNGNDSRQ